MNEHPRIAGRKGHGLTGDLASLALLAACDAQLHEKRRRKAELVRDLEEQRAEIGRLEAPGRGHRAGRPRPATPLALEPDLGPADRLLYLDLVRQFEGDLQRAAPLLVRLGEEVRGLERRRDLHLSKLSPRIRTTYDSRVLAGRPPAIVPVDGDSCGGCGGRLHVELVEEAVPICPACQRLLYWPPTTDGAA